MPCDRSCQKMLRYTPTPIQELHDPAFHQAGVRLLIKREDLNHPLVSGNKWWKLKYNLEEAHRQKKKMLLTFGGAYSNHIFATATAAQELGFESIGIIRGEETLPLNHTLSFARSKGMKLHYISREKYKTKSQPEFINKLQDQFGDFYLIPEGGTNALAVKGVTEFAATLPEDFDYLCCSVGTGGTLAGLINEMSNTKNVLGFSALMGEGSLEAEVMRWLSVGQCPAWKILTDYHFGGYGKSPDALRAFSETFQVKYNIPLDFIYTSKMMFGILDLIKRNFFKRGSTILAIHTGGLQGNN